MKYIYSLFFFIGLFPFGLKTAAQKPNIIPPSPNAASFTKYGDIPVNLSSGTLNLQIPVYKASEGSLDWAISLDYNYTGFRPADAASWVGRGWNIPLGAITRTVHGLRDEGSNVIGYDGYLLTGNTVKTNLESFENQTLTNLSFIADVVAGTKDAEPDIFNFSFAGYNGKFFFGHDGTIHTTSDQPFKITYVLSDPIDSGSGHQFVGTTFTKWTIETADGSKYIFNNAEYSWSLFSGEEFDREKKTTSAWYLSEIIGPKGDSIKFTYTSPSDQYARVQASYAQKRSIPLQSAMESCSNLNFSATNSDGLQKNISEEIFLETIRGSNWEIRFNSSQHTDEIDGGTSNFRKLNNIQVVDISQSSAGQVFKTFEFMYNGTSSNFELTQLQEKNGSTLVNPYLFTYNAGAFSLLSRNIDYWGYYNGSSNNDNLIPEFGANRQPSLPHTLTGALSSVRYPTTGYSTFEYELNTASFIQNQPFEGYNIVTQSYPYSWANVNGTMTLLVDSPFTLTDSSDYDALVSVSTGTLPEDCSALQSSGTLPPGTYSAANFMDHKCLQQNEYPLNHGPSVMVWVRRRTKTLKTEVGGLRIKKISNYTGLEAVATVKEYFYDDFSDSTRSSGVLVDSINTSSTTYATFCEQQIAVRTYQSTPIHSMSLTPLNYYNVEERIQDSRQFHNFLSYNDGYPDNYGAVMLGLVNTRLLGPIESYDFARSRPEIITSYRGTLANKASVSTSTYTLQAGLVKYLAPAIYAEQIATYNQSVSNNLNVTSAAEYYVKAYRVIDGWIKKESETSIDYGTSGTGTEVTTNYFYDNSLHKQLTRQRTTRSDGTIEEKKIRYPQDFGSSSSRAPYIQSMIDLHMLAYPLEQTTILEKSPSNRGVIDASATTYKSFTGNSVKPALILPYKNFAYNGRNGSIGTFIPYDGSTDQTASTSYRETLQYTNYNTQGNPLSLLINGGDKLSYLWSYKGQHPVAEIQNADNAEVLSALGGTSYTDMAAMTGTAAIQAKLDAVRGALPGAQMTSYLYTPLVGMSKTIDPAGKSLVYEYDALGRLTYIKDNTGKVRSSFCYNYAGQNIACGSTVPTGVVQPSAASLLADAATCGYGVTATATDSLPTMGKSIVLTAVCAGTDCSGVTYTWTGLGVSGAGASKTLFAPGSTGNFQYIVTANKGGCSIKRDTITLAVKAGGTYVVANGCYTLNVYSSRLQNESDAVGARIRVYDPTANNNQIFQLTGVDGDSYKILSASANKVWEPSSPILDWSGTYLQDWGGTTAQKWYLSPSSAANEYYFASKANPSLVMELAGGVSTAGNYTVLWPLWGAAHQRYRLDPVTCPAIGPDCDFTVTVPAGSNNLSPTMGQQITLTPTCAGTGCTGLTYTWSGINVSGIGASKTFRAPGSTGSFQYTITVSKSGCTSKTVTVTLTVQAGGSYVVANGCYTFNVFSSRLQNESDAIGARIRVYSPTTNSNQIFQLTGVDGDSYKILSVSANKVWEPSSPILDWSGTYLQNWTGTTAQKWYLSPTSVSNTYNFASKANPSLIMELGGGSLLTVITRCYGRYGEVDTKVTAWIPLDAQPRAWAWKKYSPHLLRRPRY